MIGKRIACLFLSASILLNAIQAHANEPELIQMYTTAYCQGTITATGVPVRKGICAVKKEWIGLTAIVYANDNGKPGELLGYWECNDTGFGGDANGDGIGSIQEGKVIDMYFPTESECYEWMKVSGVKCFIQLVDAEG